MNGWSLTVYGKLISSHQTSKYGIFFKVLFITSVKVIILKNYLYPKFICFYHKVQKGAGSNKVEKIKKENGF